MNKIASVLFASVLVMSATPAFAQTSAVQTLLDQIKQLEQQIIQLRQQQQQALTSLVATLTQGTSGDQVKVLQAILAADAEIYPEGKITGFFGPLTAQAVKRFQKKIAGVPLRIREWRNIRWTNMLNVAINWK